MSPNLHLIIHDVAGVLSALIIMILGFFVLLQDYRKTVNVTLGLTFLGAIIALITNVIGVSVSDPVLSRNILMWNLSVIFIAAVNFHCVMALLNREREKKDHIIGVYAISAAFLIVYLVFPDTFLHLSEPKMYFPNYYVPGSMHVVFNIIFKLIIPFYFIFQLAKASHDTQDMLTKKHYLYLTLAFILAWGFGITPTLLVYDIPVDPLWGMLFAVFFAIPFIFAIFKYQLLDIRIVAKKAFVYAVSVIGVGLVIGVLDFAGFWLYNKYPDFPVWATPLILSVLIVSIGVIIWQQLREGELLKYEFITTVTHKFRTPLTHIKWATENLKSSSAPEDRQTQLGYIEDANSKLVELTDLLANASETDETIYRYRLQKNDLSAFAEEIIQATQAHADAKRITIIKEIEPNVTAVFDATRLRFVLQTFLENGIDYTADGGTIRVKVINTGTEAIASVTDSGIGIPKQELSLISTKLYRGKRARTTDTEGMGIGLYISKGVLARHHGRIMFDSPGEGKGATFSFALPVN